MKSNLRTIRSLAPLCCLAGCFLGSAQAVVAQASAGNAPQTKFDRLLSHFDLAVAAAGEFSTNPSGITQNTVAQNGNLTIRSTNTVGAMATIRAQKSPWVGGEFNFRYAKFNQNFDFTGGQVADFAAQNTINEFTLGYVVKPQHPVFGLQPYASVGAGTIEFKPTRRTATGLPVQARADYYYSVGGDAPLVGDTFGLRVGFREAFYLAPDFGQNYLKIKKLQTSLEPTIGFYVHF